MVIKMIGLGIKGYASDHFNIFDCVIVLVGIFDVILTSILSEEKYKNSSFKGSGAISAVRTFRLLRVFKLAAKWKKF